MEFLATPLIIHAEMDESAFRYELARMQARQAATAEFVAGEIEVDDFFDMLQESGVNVRIKKLEFGTILHELIE
jgi:hypothetical protein